MPTWSELPDWALELLESSRVAHLGLLDETGHPRVQPITYAWFEDAVWSAIDDKPKRTTPARIRRLQRDPRATVTVDRYDDDWDRLAWVQILGEMAVLAVDGHERVIRALQDRYPVYRTLSPKGPLLKLTPEGVLHWRASG